MIKVQADLDSTDKVLLNTLQTEFPLSLKPFHWLARRLGVTEEEIIGRTRRLKEADILRQISAIFDSRALGYSSVLVAMKIDPSRLDSGAETVNRHSGVSHNYARDHEFNLWFTLTTPPGVSIEDEAQRLGSEAGAKAVRLLPTVRLFKIGVAFDMTDSDDARVAPSNQVAATRSPSAEKLTRDEIKAVRALQEDLPLETRPFKRLAERFEMTEDQILDMARSFIGRGIMRRYAGTLRHRAAGFRANAMGVWVVPEDRVEEVGQVMAGFAAVSHCYQRPTYPDWPYSLFTMIHGRSRAECEAVAREISDAAGIAEYRLLFSAKEYKKIRVRYFDEVGVE
ncbi:MAG: AsnC family transcriptional regulator [Armatimonadota bacterium]|nr:AsnC family transcriptional regulator [Armatimonadota bacterium]